MSLPISTYRTPRHSIQIQSQYLHPWTARRFIQNNKRKSQERAVQSHENSDLNRYDQTEKKDEYRQTNSVSEEWMLRIDAVYTELEDELIQFKNRQTKRMQSIIQRQQTSEHSAHSRIAQLLAKTNCIASKIRTTLEGDRHSLNRGGQNLNCASKFSDCWYQSMNGDIDARISLAMVGDQ